MHILDTLKERGLLAQVTFEDELYKLLGREQVTFYVGFDPTADSLHIGHFIPIIAMAWMQRAGHKPIALMGGGTGMIGDPSGRTDLRAVMTAETVAHNVAAIKGQMSRFLDFGEGAAQARIINNADWLLHLNYVAFLREVGVHFSVNRMLTADCYKQRMEKGLSFLEFNYMIMQAYDFLVLHREHGCKLQMGGDDQWSNILAGADLIRRKERSEAFALTYKLLLKSDGEKMGKTSSGALWLDPDRKPPFEMYQYFRNIDDADVRTCLSMLTFLPMEEVGRLSSLPGERINEAKQVLGYEIVKLIHGEARADECLRMAASLFGGGGDEAPTTRFPRDEVMSDPRIVRIMALCGLAKSIGEARRLVEGGGVAAGGEAVTAADAVANEADFAGEGLLIRKGKKTYHRIQLM